MRRRADFARTVRGGRRGSSRRVVVHLADDDAASPASVGFVVPRVVGGAVERNLVKRRLRALVAGRLELLPKGALLVVRALPSARGAAGSDLSSDLDRALERVGIRPTGRTGERPR